MLAIFPYAVAVLAVSCYALLSPIAKKVGVHLPPLTLIAFASLLVGLGAGILAFFFEKEKLLAAWGQIEWPWLVAFAGVNLLGFGAYLFAITRIPVAQYQMFGILNPIIGGVFAYFLLNEPLEPRYGFALLLIAGGLYVACRPSVG